MLIRREFLKMFNICGWSFDFWNNIKTLLKQVKLEDRIRVLGKIFKFINYRETF